MEHLHRMNFVHHNMDESGHQNKDMEHNHHPKQHQETDHSSNVDTARDHDKHKGHSTEDFKRRFIISIILTIPILFLSPMIQHLIGMHESLRFTGDVYLLFLISSVVYFYGGYPFLKGLIQEMHNLQPGMMTLIALAISTAYFYSSAVVFGLPGELFFWELATLIDIMLIGHWLEMRSVMGASKALEELSKLLPDNASRIDHQGNIVEVKTSELKTGDMILIKPGEKIPADGIVAEGQTSVNESMITGEAKPSSKKKDDRVTGGSVNGEGSVKVRIDKTGEESFLSQVVKMVKEAQASKSATQNFADRAAFWLTITAVLSGVLTMLLWLLAGDASFNFALSRTVTVLVIACPHALGLAIPLVVSVSTAISARNGLLIRNRTAFEQARNTGAVIFDKTGTLTEGTFGVTDVQIFNNEYTKEEILKLAASVEAESEHPIAEGILRSSGEKYKVRNFHSIPGKGAEGEVNGHNVKVVSPGYIKENQIKVPVEIKSIPGGTVVYVLIDNNPAAAVTLNDVIREDSKNAVKQLKQMGIKTIMLTGDNKASAEWAAGELGIDEYFAEVLPAQKADKIKEIQKRGLVTVMAGDGVNDAPGLAAADVGIAIGAGTDVAVETADIILVRNNPADVVTLIEFAKTTYRKMIQNLIWAAGYNIIAMPLAAGVLYSEGIVLSPALGAVLMSVSTIVVAVNARLLSYKGKDRN